jgi:N-acetylneuraminic acid mutarotase
MSRLSLLALLLPLALSANAAAQTPAWQEVAPLAESRSETRAAVIGNKFYVVAGYNTSGQQLSSLERYDPAANAWTTLAPAPRGMDHHMVAAHGGKLYVLKYADIYVYDTLTNTWSSRPDSSGQTRSDGTAVTIGDHIYVMGGGPLPIQRYHVATRQWETRASLQTSRGHLHAVVFENKIWILAGRNGNTAYRTVEIYDPATNQITAGPSMDSIRSGHAAEVVNGKILVVGGEIPGPGTRISHSTEIYDPAVGAWASFPNPPLGLHGVASASWNGRLYLLGGATVASSATNTNRAFYVQVQVPGPTSIRPLLKSGFQTPSGPFLRRDGGSVAVERDGESYRMDGRLNPGEPRLAPTGAGD